MEFLPEKFLLYFGKCLNWISWTKLVLSIQLSEKFTIYESLVKTAYFYYKKSNGRGISYEKNILWNPVSSVYEGFQCLKYISETVGWFGKKLKPWFPLQLHILKVLQPGISKLNLITPSAQKYFEHGNLTNHFKYKYISCNNVYFNKVFNEHWLIVKKKTWKMFWSTGS